tara:strand:+ start:518 stop:682 length:165 start_codon:yes stop_codon:yes gene_type:complete
MNKLAQARHLLDGYKQDLHFAYSDVQREAAQARITSQTQVIFDLINNTNNTKGA